MGKITLAIIKQISVIEKNVLAFEKLLPFSLG